MIQNTLLLLLILAALSHRNIAKPTMDGEQNGIADSVLEFRAQYAAQMLSYMNLSVAPCDDFYEYACGNWKNTIADHKSTEDGRLHLLDIKYNLDDIVENFLQRPDINDVAPEYAYELELAKKFYQNCLASDMSSMHKSNEYLKVLGSIGGFPAVDPNWNASQFSWFNMSAHLSNYDTGSLIKEEMTTDYPFTPQFPLPVFGYGIELHYDTIHNVSSNAYQLNKRRMEEMLSVYEVSEDKSKKIIADVFDFLGDVINMTKTYDESQMNCYILSAELDSSLNDTLREQFISYLDIAWMGKFKYVAYNQMPCIYFYDQLNTICDKHKEAVANYLSMMFLYRMDDHDQDDGNFQREFCVDEINQSFSTLFDHLYMKMHFTQDMADDVMSMSHGIRESMISVLKNTDLLDEPTREAALLKASALKVNVGRYEDSEAHKSLLAQLRKLQFVEGDNYEANKINLKKFNVYMERYYGLHQEDFNIRTKPLPILKAMAVNAFYYAIDNTMYIAAGILQPPAYHKDWPISLKMGTLGATIGHELGHSYDTMGSRFDSTGQEKDWWTENVTTDYIQLAQCFVKHYNNYSIEEINRNLNGEKTLDENIADSSGLLTAYMTYRRYIDSRESAYESDLAYKKDQGLPGLDVTPDQLFFLGNAQLWCSKYKESHYWKQLADPHSIAKYRVLGVAANSKDFANAFNCKLGDKMNAVEDKCHMW